MEQFNVFFQNLFGALVGPVNDHGNLGIYFLGSCLGIRFCLGHLPADEYIVIMVFIGKGSQIVAHAETSHHVIGQFGGLLDIIGCTCADSFEDNFFCNPATKGNGQFIFQLILVFEIPFFG